MRGNIDISFLTQVLLPVLAVFSLPLHLSISAYLYQNSHSACQILTSATDSVSEDSGVMRVLAEVLRP